MSKCVAGSQTCHNERWDMQIWNMREQERTMWEWIEIGAVSENS